MNGRELIDFIVALSLSLFSFEGKQGLLVLTGGGEGTHRGRQGR